MSYWNVDGNADHCPLGYATVWSDDLLPRRYSWFLQNSGNELPDCMASDPKDNNLHSQYLENLILYRHGIIIFHFTVINIHLT